MAEKITNGAFQTNLSGWSNYGSSNFVASSSRAHSESGFSGGTYQCKLRQYFSISGAVSSAILNAHIYWDIVHKTHHGSCQFYLYLRRPDSTMVELADRLEDGDADNFGDMQMADDLDIYSSFNQVGTYALELWANTKSAWDIPIDEPVYYASSADFDDISLAVTERVTKMIMEGLGGGELTKRNLGSASLEVAGIEESISHHGGYQPGVDPKYEFVQRNKAGLHEHLTAILEGNETEGAGLHESLTRTYSYRQRVIPGMTNQTGLHEYLRARWTKGNITMCRTITPVDSIWMKVVPSDETNWQSLTDQTPGVVGNSGATSLDEGEIDGGGA